MKIPKIKIDVYSGEAVITNWGDFDKENALWKLDVLGDLKEIIDYKYLKANKEYFHQLEKTNG